MLGIAHNVIPENVYEVFVGLGGFPGLWVPSPSFKGGDKVSTLWANENPGTVKRVLRLVLVLSEHFFDFLDTCLNFLVH